MSERTPYWETHIRPMFRPLDREHMLTFVDESRRFDLFDYDDNDLKELEKFHKDRFSIADISALCAIDFARIVQIRPAPEHEQIARWHAQVSARPSARA